MVEAEIENIKTKLKSDDYDIISLEKKVLKIEKKIIQLENKINISNITNTIKEDNDSSDSDYNINFDLILKELEKLESELTQLSNLTNSNSIENLLDKYINFKTKINAIKIKNDDFKLSIDYL